MKCNIGKVDRTLRLVLGMVVIGLGFYYQSLWGALGIIFLTTAMLGWCPMYVPFNISTDKGEKDGGCGCGCK